MKRSEGNHRLLLLLLQTLSRTRELPAPRVRSVCAEEAWSGPDAHRAQRGRGEEPTETEAGQMCFWLHLTTVSSLSRGRDSAEPGAASPLQSNFSGSSLAEMRRGRFCAQAPGPVAPLSRSFLCVTLLLTSCLAVCEAFNLDVESPTVYSGPAGSYFGYAVDFYLVNPSR